VAKFLQEHASPSDQAALLSRRELSSKDLDRMREVLGISAELYASEDQPMRQLLGPPARSDIDLVVLPRFPPIVLLGVKSVPPLLILPPFESGPGEWQRPIDVPDLVDNGVIIRVRLDYAASIGRRTPIADRELAFVREGKVVARATSRHGEVELPSGLGDSLGLFRITGKEAADPLALVEAWVAILRAGSRPIVLFDAEIEKDRLTLIGRVAWADPVGVRIRPVHSCASLRAKQRSAGLPPYVIDAGTILISGVLTDRSVEISVTDSGIGIPPEEQDAIFDEFHQANVTTRGVKESTGLGFAICRRLVENHGGQIGVTSKVGKGSCFTFTLPLRSEAIMPADAVVSLVPPADVPRILIIDDELEARELLVNYVESEGFYAATANSGKEAIRKALEFHPDVITLDVLMGADDGWTALHELKTNPRTASIPVVIVSVLDEKQTGFALGAAEYLVKPVSKDTLLAALARHVARNQKGPTRVLVIDDEMDALQLVAEVLQSADYLPVAAGSGEEGLRILSQLRIDGIVLDLVMPGMDGFEVLTASDPDSGWELVRKVHPQIVLLDLVMPGIGGMDLLARIVEWDPGIDVLLLTGHYSTESAVEAIQKGACDYLTKPITPVALRERVEKLLGDALKRRRALQLEGELLETSRFDQMVGRSPQMLEVFARIRRVAPHFRNALVTGGTGTGKELVARALHNLSPFSSGRFAVCNCSALVETLFESELFGHVKGAFTGATQDRVGHFEYASGGTLFLDEIGDMPMSTQSKLLRVLQNQEVQRVGSPSVRKVDVRVVAATNRDLRQEILDKQFREDLYYRLSMVEIKVLRI
jgi:DNA-binding NtrC family response regulator